MEPTQPGDDFIGRLLDDTSPIFDQTIPANLSSNPLPAPATVPANAPVAAGAGVDDDWLVSGSKWLNPAPAAYQTPPAPPSPAPPVVASSAPVLPPPPFATALSAIAPPSTQQEDAPSDSTAPKQRAGEPLRFYKGLFYQNDADGTVKFYRPASFFRRGVGAVLDYILASIVGTIFSATLGQAILSQFFDPSMVLSQQLLQLTRGNKFNYLQEQLTNVAMISGLMSVIVSIAYYTLLIGLLGRTVGHMGMGLKVFRSSGEKADIIAGFLRTLYGALPGIVTLFLAPLLFSAMFENILGRSKPDLNNYFTVLVCLFIFNLIIFFGFIWITMDKMGQGWHDKLADTYVLRKFKMTDEEAQNY